MQEDTSWGDNRWVSSHVTVCLTQFTRTTMMIVKGHCVAFHHLAAVISPFITSRMPGTRANSRIYDLDLSIISKSVNTHSPASITHVVIHAPIQDRLHEPMRRLCLEHRPVELCTNPESKSDSRGLPHAKRQIRARSSRALQPCEPFNFGKPSLI